MNTHIRVLMMNEAHSATINHNTCTNHLCLHASEKMNCLRTGESKPFNLITTKLN